jgi:hypothetical protein
MCVDRDSPADEARDRDDDPTSATIAGPEAALKGPGGLQVFRGGKGQATGRLEGTGG